MQARLHLNAGALIFKHGRVDLMFKESSLIMNYKTPWTGSG